MIMVNLYRIIWISQTGYKRLSDLFFTNMKNSFSLHIISIGILFIGCDSARQIGNQKAVPDVPTVKLELVDWHSGPVLKRGDPGTEDIKHGIEGGSVIKIDKTYHLFTSEQFGDPKWVKMRLGHWKSNDGISWQRVSTLFESSGDYTGKDTRAALWSPMPVFDADQDRWYMTYVAYTCQPDTKTQFRNNYDGRIWISMSSERGIEGFGGPYEDMKIIMEPGPDSDPWEGLQGTDSFYPFKCNDRWLAFYGSAKTESLPIQFWGVGLAESENLEGSWKRLSDKNPVDFEENFTENPIVTLVNDSIYIAVMDAHGDGFGYSASYDGLNWTPMEHIEVSEKMKSWWSEFRTPLCLIHESEDLYTVFFTATDENTDYWEHMGEEGYMLDTGFDNMGKLTVRVVIEN